MSHEARETAFLALRVTVGAFVLSFAMFDTTARTQGYQNMPRKGCR